MRAINGRKAIATMMHHRDGCMPFGRCRWCLERCQCAVPMALNFNACAHTARLAQLDTFEIEQGFGGESHHEHRVLALRGGMSAELGVQKCLGS